jgi:hypothetical protein
VPKIFDDPIIVITGGGGGTGVVTWTPRDGVDANQVHVANACDIALGLFATCAIAVIPTADQFQLINDPVAVTVANAMDFSLAPTANNISVSATVDTIMDLIAQAITVAAATDENVVLNAVPVTVTASVGPQQMRIWLSGTVANTANGVTNPGNADGPNDGAVCTIQSAAAGAAQPSTFSAVGANIPAGASVTSAIYRGWFKSVTTLTTSSTFVECWPVTSLFVAFRMFNGSGLNTTIDHSSGDFTFDLVAAGLTTLAKLQDVKVLHASNDAAAGVSPAVLTVDAGCIELTF